MKKLASCAYCLQYRTYEGDFSEKNKIYYVKCSNCGKPGVVIHGAREIVTYDDIDRDFFDDDDDR